MWFNPFFALLMVVCTLFFGLEFLVYMVVTSAISSIIGWWLEKKLLAYDCAIRVRAKEITGRDQPGDNRDFARNMRSACKLLGPLTVCIFPIVMTLYGSYVSWRTARVVDGRAFRSPFSSTTGQVCRTMRRTLRGQARGHLPAPSGPRQPATCRY